MHVGTEGAHERFLNKQTPLLLRLRRQQSHTAAHKGSTQQCECHTVGQGGKGIRDGGSGPQTDSCSMFMGSSSPHQMWMQVHVTCECTCICTSSRQSCTCLLCEWWVGGCGGDYSTDLEKAEGGRKLSLGVKAREQVVGDVEEHQGR